MIITTFLRGPYVINLPHRSDRRKEMGVLGDALGVTLDLYGGDGDEEPDNREISWLRQSYSRSKCHQPFVQLAQRDPSVKQANQRMGS